MVNLKEIHSAKTVIVPLCLIDTSTTFKTQYLVDVLNLGFNPDFCVLNCITSINDIVAPNAVMYSLSSNLSNGPILNFTVETAANNLTIGSVYPLYGRQFDQLTFQLSQVGTDGKEVTPDPVDNSTWFLSMNFTFYKLK